MKKFLLMLALMLPCLGVWAAVTKPESGVYVISGDNPAGKRGNLAAVEGITAHPALSNITWGTYAGNSATPITNGEHWYVYQVGDKYVIYNLGLKKYLVNPKNGSQINFGDTPYLWDILVNSSNNNFNSIWDATGTYLCFACGKNAANRNVHFNNQPDDGGSLHTFTAVENGATTYAEDITKVVEASPEVLSYELTDCFGVTHTGSYAGYRNVDAPTFAGLTVNLTSWEDKKFVGTVTYPFPVSNAEVTNKLMMNGYQYNSLNFKMYVKDETAIRVDKGLEPTIDNVENYLWAIYPNFEEGTYTIKNIATDKYIHTEQTTGSHGETALSLDETPTKFNLVKDSWGYSFKVADKTLYLSINSSGTATEQPVGVHGNTHAGSSWGFIPYVVNYELTDEANNTFTGEAEGWAALEIAPTFTGAEGYTLSNQSWSGNTFSATINFPFTVSSASQANPIYIRQETNGTFDDDLWTAVAGKVTVVDGAPLLGASQWMIYPSLNGSEFTFKIKSVSAHKYVTATAEDEPITLTETGTSFNFIPTTNESYNGFAYTAGGKTLFVTSEPEVADKTPLGLAEANDTYVGNNVGFPEANSMNSFKVEIGAVGYTTVYAPFTAACLDDGYNPDFVVNGLEAYTIANKPVNDRIPLTPVHFDWCTVIPKNGAAILKGEGTYVFTLVDDDWYSGMEEAWEENWLEGTSVNTYIQGDAYVLSAPDGEESIGLYKAKLNKDASGAYGDTHFLNNAWKAYLPAYLVETTAGALRFNFGGTTAIESVLNNGVDANAPIYDLSGRRVMNAVKGGIYIQNGKKFIVK